MKRELREAPKLGRPVGGRGRCAQLRVYKHKLTGAHSAQARIAANSLVLNKCIAKRILSWQNIGFYNVLYVLYHVHDGELLAGSLTDVADYWLASQLEEVI
jgi:hypothetical protein